MVEGGVPHLPEAGEHKPGQRDADPVPPDGETPLIPDVEPREPRSTDAEPISRMPQISRLSIRMLAATLIENR